jgi:hypothetical protein
MDQSMKIRLAFLAVAVGAHLALAVVGLHFSPLDEIGGAID